MSQVISFFSRLNDDIEIGCMDASTSNVFSFDLRLSYVNFISVNKNCFKEINR